MTFCQCVAFVATLQLSLLVAQVSPSVQPSAQLSYVASVKRANKADAPGFWITPGRLLASGVTAKYLVAIGYGVQKFQITGGAAWTDRDQFHIESKLQDEKAIPDAEKLMIQLLLKDRFQLILHQETRESSIYALVVAKGRSKLKPSSAASLGGVNIGPGRLEGTGMSLGLVASLLGTRLGRTVIDRTNLAGLYDIRISWTPETGEPLDPGEAIPRSDAPGPSIFTAIEEQLGLRLLSTRGPTGFYVIDRIEQPDVN